MNELDALIEKAKTTVLVVKEQRATAFVKFTKRELRRMANPLKSGFALIEKRATDNGSLYKIYYQNVAVVGKDLKTAKKLFIKAV